MIAQEWRDVLFLNYKINPSALKKVLHDHLRKNLSDSVVNLIEVDTFEGWGFLSLVSFRMSGVRFPFTPVLPFSKLWELNLRTYINYKGRKGIYFFTLDTDHHIAKWIARTFFSLPYRYRFLRASISKNEYFFESPGSFKVSAKKTKTALAIESYHHWLVERYSLFTEEKGKLWRGDVNHRPWKLNYSQITSLDESLQEEFFPGIKTDFDSSFYSEFLPVSFNPFKQVYP